MRDLEAGDRRAANLTRRLLMLSRRAVLEAVPLELEEVAGGRAREQFGLDKPTGG